MHVADRRVASDDGRQLDGDPAGDLRARHVEQEFVQRCQPVLEVDAGRAFRARCVLEPDLRAIGDYVETWFRAERKASRTLRRVRVLQRSGRKPERLHVERFVIEVEVAGHAIGRRRRLARIALIRSLPGRGVELELARVVQPAVGDAHAAVSLQRYGITLRNGSDAKPHPPIRVRRACRRRQRGTHAVEP